MTIPEAKYTFLDEVRVKQQGPLRRYAMKKSVRQKIGETGFVGLVAWAQHTNQPIYTIVFKTSDGPQNGCYFEDELELVKAREA